MGDNENRTEETMVDESFGDFLKDIPEETANEEEEVLQEEDSQEEVQDEAVEEAEAGSEEESEEEAETSEEDETGEDYEESEDPRDAAIRELREELNALKSQQKAQPQEEKEEPPPALPDDLQQRILGDLDIDDVTSDPKLFTQVLQKAISLGRDLTYEHVMKRIPKMVIQQAKGYQDLMEMTRRFYNQNKDLRSYKNTVAAAANEIHSEHPEWGVEQIMTEAAKRARKSIGLSKKAQKQPTPPGKKQTPAFAKTPKAKQVKQQISKLQQDINSTLDL